jgi:spermidine/putrescine transport system permease protein
LFIAPFSLVILYSFHGRDFFGGITDNWSLSGWRDLLSPSIVAIIIRSVTMAGLNTAACMVVGIPLAVSIYECSPRVKKLWLTALVFPMAVNTLLVAYSWQVLLGNTGLINSALMSLGIIREPIVILFTPVAIIIGLFASYLPYFIVAFLTSLERLDYRYVMASHSLGAKHIQTLWKVILPMSRPGLITGGLLVFLPSFAEYVIPDLLGGGKVFLVGSLTQFAFYEGRNWPMGAALMVTTILLLSFLTIPIVRYIRGVFET